MLNNFWNSWPTAEMLPSELQELLRQAANTITGNSTNYPPVNIWRGPEGVALAVQLPGYDPEHVEITANRNTIVLRGSRPETQLAEGQKHLTNERHSGDFMRSIELPFEVDAENTTATFRDGILLISVARPKEQIPRQIPVRAAQ